MTKNTDVQKEKGNHLSRRVFLAGAGLVAILSGAVVYTACEQPRAQTRTPIRTLPGSPSFLEAKHDPRKRAAYARKLLPAEEHFKVDYMSRADFIRKTIKNKSAPGNYAVTTPDDIAFIGKGTHSTIYMTDKVFEPETDEQGAADLELVVQNTLKNHEKLHADHFRNGIPGYNLREFQDGNGNLNLLLFHVVSEMICYGSEYKNIKGMAGNKPKGLMQYELQEIFDVASNVYLRLIKFPQVTQDADPAFIQRLRKELHPSVLLK